MVDSLERLTKGAEIMGYSLMLMRDEIKTLRAANEATKRRKSHKRKRLQNETNLTIEEGARLTALKEFGARSDRKKIKKRVRVDRDEPTQRRCGWCGDIGYNLRTYKKDIGIVSE